MAKKVTGQIKRPSENVKGMELLEEESSLTVQNAVQKYESQFGNLRRMPSIVRYSVGSSSKVYLRSRRFA